jgi:PBP1b-binding outer membrane lipoprotein LpoB
MKRILSLMSLALIATGCAGLDKKDAPPPLVPSTTQVHRQPPVTPAEISAANAKAKLQQLQDEMDREANENP